jgi:4-hydroxyphenylpyruvate dioxygenase
MHRSIATVSMSGTLRDKLEAIAAARFDGYELFENDLLYFKGSPNEVAAIANDLGLGCDLYQPFRDFEGMPDDVFRRNLDRAERKFDVMQALSCPLMLVCSNTSPQVIDDEQRAAAQLYELAERAAKRNLRIGYEALAWGKAVNLFRQAWAIVKRANHPHLGLILDSFHTLSLRDDPSGIVDIPGGKIFFLQMADAPLLGMDVLQWARHYRNFPGQGQFDVENFFEKVLLAGYNGPLSLEIFNDVFRESPNRRTATDAMRSLLYLEGQVRNRLENVSASESPAKKTATRVLDRIELYDPPKAPVFSGFAFLEFAVDDAFEWTLGQMLTKMGFRRAGKHRSKNVTLYRQGDINVILNADAGSYARKRFLEQGPSLCAVGLRTDDPVRARNRATALMSAKFDSPLGPNEAQVPAIISPGGTLVYFVGDELGPSGLLETDFELGESARAHAHGAPLSRIDHVAFGLTMDRLDSWVLFCRAVLGMETGHSAELADPFGLIRTAGVASHDRSVRFVLNVSLSQRTRTAQTVSAAGGVGAHHIAFACSDIFATLERLRRDGLEFVPISRNYYDDILARIDIDAATVEKMAQLSVLYDRNADGAYFHAYSTSFADRFFFEIVQRVDGYDAYGALNAPARMASQVQAA